MTFHLPSPKCLGAYRSAARTADLAPFRVQPEPVVSASAIAAYVALKDKIIPAVPPLCQMRVVMITDVKQPPRRSGVVAGQRRMLGDLNPDGREPKPH
jgi:hypothetical protein